MLVFVASKTGKSIKEAGNMTRVELGLLYAELKREEQSQAALTASFLLPGLQACGLTATGQKKAATRAGELFRNLQKDLNRINNAER